MSNVNSVDKWNCQADEFHCADGYPACISITQVCDSIRHCDKASDENNCGKKLKHTVIKIAHFKEYDVYLREVWRQHIHKKWRPDITLLPK